VDGLVVGCVEGILVGMTVGNAVDDVGAEGAAVG
jgi:hypothetical protein